MRFLVLDEKQKMASARRKFFMNLQDEVKIVNDYNKLEDMTSTSFSTVEYDIDFLKENIITFCHPACNLKTPIKFTSFRCVYAFLALKAQTLNNHLIALVHLFDVPSFTI